jgi:hypothetical protein
VQLRQLQFHCGKPPPAAEPSTRIFTAALGRVGSGPRSERAYGARRPGSQPMLSLAVRDVHRDFHAEAEISRSRRFPAHSPAPHLVDRPASAASSVSLSRQGGASDHHESGLMIFLRTRELTRR